MTCVSCVAHLHQQCIASDRVGRKSATANGERRRRRGSEEETSSALAAATGEKKEEKVYSASESLEAANVQQSFGGVLGCVGGEWDL